MAKEFDVSLFDSGALVKRGVGAILENAGKAVAAITLVVTALVLFTDIGFTDFRAESFTSTLAVMLLSSYVMFFSMSEAGEKAAESSKGYKESSERYLKLAARVRGDDLGRLRDFCKKYTAEELEYRRCDYLIKHGYTRSEYDSYRSGEAVDRRARRVFRRAERLKAATLTPRSLLSNESKRERAELFNPENTKLITMVLKMLPTTLCMLLTVSVMLRAKSGLTVADVIDGLFKLFSLPIIGFRGYASGYTFKSSGIPLWLDTKSRLLEAFLNREE